VAANQKRSPQHDKGGFAIRLQLGALVGVERVLDRKLMLFELRLKLPQISLVRGLDTNPDT
jgi:hypothetical protein